jgi:hypothetical protein
MLRNNKLRGVSSAPRGGGHPAAGVVLGRQPLAAAVAVPVHTDDGISAYIAGCQPALTITILAKALRIEDVQMSERPLLTLG